MLRDNPIRRKFSQISGLSAASNLFQSLLMLSAHSAKPAEQVEGEQQSRHDSVESGPVPPDPGQSGDPARAAQQLQ